MHEYFQSILFFFIESCSFVTADCQWWYFILYETTNNTYDTVAFTTMYEDKHIGNRYGLESYCA